MEKNFWLMKCEARECTFEDLKMRRAKRTGKWRGVRNYQARNFLRDEMQKGDLVFFYQSNCENPGIAGIAEIVRSAYPDPSAFDPANKYYDPKSTPENPRWFSVDVKWKRPFKRFVSLKLLKATPELADMKVVQRGQRLSVQPVARGEFERVCQLGEGD